MIVRIGSVAFRMTGLSPDAASLQAVSAFAGAGFTTDRDGGDLEAHADAVDEHERVLDEQAQFVGQ